MCNTEDAPNELAAKLAKRKKEAHKAATTPASPKEASLNPQGEALLQNSLEACLQKRNASGSTTTSPLPAPPEDKWAEVDQLLAESTSIVSEMEKIQEEPRDTGNFFTTQPTSKKK